MIDPMSRLRAIAADPHGGHSRSTARQIIEARLGRSWRDMAPDEREAVRLLAIELVRNRRHTA